MLMAFVKTSTVPSKQIPQTNKPTPITATAIRIAKIDFFFPKIENTLVSFSQTVGFASTFTSLSPRFTPSAIYFLIRASSFFKLYD